MKVKICTPHYNPLKQDFLDQLTTLEKSFPEITWIKAFCKGTSITFARNNLINSNKSYKKFQTEFDADYYFFIDDDITFTPQDFEKLLKADKGVIGGIYRKRSEIEQYSFGHWNEKIGMAKLATELTFRDVQKVDLVFAGFSLIKSTVLKNLEYPWYREYLVKLSDEQKAVYEDIGFCAMCSEYNIPVFVHGDVRVGHNPI